MKNCFSLSHLNLGYGLHTSALPERYRQFGSEEQQQVKSRKQNVEGKGEELNLSQQDKAKGASISPQIY